MNDYFQFIVKKQSKEHKDDIKIFAKRIANQVAFKLKSGLSLEMMTPETHKFLGSNSKTITGDVN